MDHRDATVSEDVRDALGIRVRNRVVTTEGDGHGASAGDLLDGGFERGQCGLVAGVHLYVAGVHDPQVDQAVSA